jgi:molybdopterin biosynthesis enzyme
MPPSSLLTFEEARARILSGVAPAGHEAIPVTDAAGRVLAEADDLPEGTAVDVLPLGAI